MVRDSQSTFLSSYITTYEHPLTTAQRKLDDLVEKIETCKMALKTAVLNGQQSLMARHLVSSLDQGVDELASQISSRLNNPEPAAGMSLFNEHVDRLLTICKQLSAAVVAKGCCAAMA